MLRPYQRPYLPDPDISFSIASVVRGAPADSHSPPFAVTSTSSSIRTPSFSAWR